MEQPISNPQRTAGLERMMRFFRSEPRDGVDTLNRKFDEWEATQNQGLEDEGTTLRQKYGLSATATPLEVFTAVSEGRIPETTPPEETAGYSPPIEAGRN